MKDIHVQTFAVSGMTCSSCVNSIERALNEIDGVTASVNFASETVHIAGPADLSPDVVMKKIKSAGYSASLLKDNADPALHRKGAARALFFALIFAVPSIAISMVMSWHQPINDWLIELFTNYSIALPPHADHLFASWLVLALSAPLIFIVAFPIHRAAIRNILHPTMDTLISLGSLSAYIWSSYATYTNQGDVYTEVAAGVLLFVILGRFLESRAKRSAASALSTLLALGEKEVAVLRNGTEVLIPISHLVIGDEFVVKPGAHIATDGVVISGQSSVDNSLITGESLPVHMAPGKRVIGATINGTGRLIVRAERVGAQTELSRIARMVVQAQGEKAPIARIADRIAAIFVPTIIGLSIITFAIWFVLTRDLSQSIAPAITLLVIACPCALGLATPIAFLVASGRGAQLGIILRTPAVLERAQVEGRKKKQKADSKGNQPILLLDKTGTVTTGQIEIIAVQTFGIDEHLLLSIAGTIENQSEHPIARGVVALAKNKGVAFGLIS